MSSNHFGFRAFTAEVNESKSRQKRKNLFYLALLSIGFGIFTFGISDRANNKNSRISTTNLYRAAPNYRSSLEMMSKSRHGNNENSLTLVSSLAQTFLPDTGILQGGSNPNTNSGALRIFLREPKPEEGSNLEKKCESDNTNHYWN